MKTFITDLMPTVYIVKHKGEWFIVGSHLGAWKTRRQIPAPSYSVQSVRTPFFLWERYR